MTPAERLVACPRWRWMPGMHRIDSMLPKRRMLCRSANVGPGWLPDLADPATLGCLLALVREAHGEPELYCSPQTGPGWGVYLGGEEIALADTEVEALVAALESAP